MKNQRQKLTKAAKFEASKTRKMIVLNRFESKASPELVEKFIAFYRKRYQELSYDGKEPRNLDVMARYAGKYWSGVADKGLCLVGDTGRGKTFGMEIMQHLFRLDMYNAGDLVEKWEEYGIKRRNDFWSDMKGSYTTTSGHIEIDRLYKDIIIDDIGTEPTLNDYGTKIEVIDAILQKRYRDLRQRDAFTHLTFNYVLEPVFLNKVRITPPGCSIVERYGARIVSRLHEMCHVVTMIGDDRRKRDTETDSAVGFMKKLSRRK